MTKWVAVETYGRYKGSPWHIATEEGELITVLLDKQQAEEIVKAHNDQLADKAT